MRIVGGTHRGTNLAPIGAGDAAAHLRPTPDRVREAIFNLLVNGRAGGGANPLTDARVLDLFAGTGALGLEALSRGAAHATLVDDGKAAQALIRANREKLGLADRMTLLAADATRLPPNTNPPCVLIFLDPPYGTTLGHVALTSAVARGWIAPGSLIVWEDNRPPAPPAGFDLIDRRRYGETHVTILRRVERP